MIKKDKGRISRKYRDATINYIFSIFYYKVAVIKKYTNSNDSQLEDATNENWIIKKIGVKKCTNPRGEQKKKNEQTRLIIGKRSLSSRAKYVKIERRYGYIQCNDRIEDTSENTGSAVLHFFSPVSSNMATSIGLSVFRSTLHRVSFPRIHSVIFFQGEKERKAERPVFEVSRP